MSRVSRQKATRIYHHCQRQDRNAAKAEKQEAKLKRREEREPVAKERRPEGDGHGAIQT